MRTYALQVNNQTLKIENETKFNFHAENLEEAINLGKGWCHHHGFCYGQDYLVIEEEAKNSSWIHNKYMVY